MGQGKCAFFAHDFSHLYTTGTKREMRKNSIEFFHIPFLLYNQEITLELQAYIIKLYECCIGGYYLPVYFSSQYLHLYTCLTGSERTNTWSRPCSIEVIHLGFLHLITLVICFGNESDFLSTICPSLIILTVIL